MKSDEFTDNIIDKKDFFRQKQAQNMLKNVQSVAKDIGDIYGTMLKNEEWMKHQLAQIDQLPNHRLREYRLLLSSLRREFAKETSILDILFWAHADDDDFTQQQHKIAVDFVNEHIDEIIAIIEEQLSAMKSLEKLADQKKWPAPWRIYTKYSYLLSSTIALHRYFQAIRRAM